MTEHLDVSNQSWRRQSTRGAGEPARSPTQLSTTHGAAETSPSANTAPPGPGVQPSGDFSRRFILNSGNEFQTREPENPLVFVDNAEGVRRLVSDNDFQPRTLPGSDAGQSEGGSSVKRVDDLGFSAGPAPLESTILESELSDDDVMDVVKLRRHLGLRPKPVGTVQASIRDKMWQCLEYSSREDQRQDRDSQYLPVNDFEKILGIEPIRAFVKEAGGQVPGADFTARIKTVLGRRRILGILILMKACELFKGFVSNGILDKDLPLKPSVIDPVTSSSSLDTGDEPHPTTPEEEWGNNEITLFYSYQPILFVPFFDIQDRKLSSYILDACLRLPWRTCERKSSGGNGIIHRVEIHPSQHNFVSKIQRPNEPLYFALKEITTRDVEIYRQELEALEKTCVQIQKAEHLIKLLLTFQHGERYYFLFEWANCNLHEYWERNSEAPRDRTPTKTIWAAKQCWGLASAVKQIHGLSTWQKQRGETSPSGSEGVEKQWGRHGDIKPNNILWFSSDEGYGSLVLSDLGVTTFHSKVSKSAVPLSLVEALGYTGPYRPPEMVMPGMYVCQKYDIWSLGCVLLEFCIWWLEGIEAVERFEFARTERDDLYSSVEEDRYFVVRESLDKTLVPEVSVKPVVLEWIGQLRQDHKHDAFAIPMLKLIEEKMLVVKKDDRDAADLICREILKIVEDVRQAEGLREDSVSDRAPRAVDEQPVGMPEDQTEPSGLAANGLIVKFTEGNSSSATTRRPRTVSINTTSSSGGDLSDEASGEPSTPSPTPTDGTPSSHHQQRTVLGVPVTSPPTQMSKTGLGNSRQHFKPAVTRGSPTKLERTATATLEDSPSVVKGKKAIEAASAVLENLDSNHETGPRTPPDAGDLNIQPLSTTTGAKIDEAGPFPHNKEELPGPSRTLDVPVHNNPVFDESSRPPPVAKVLGKCKRTLDTIWKWSKSSWTHLKQWVKRSEG